MAKPKSPAPSEKKSDKKKFIAIGALLTSTPFLIAIAVHGLLLVLGGSIVIFKGGNPLAIFTSQNVGEVDAGAEPEAPPAAEEPSPEPDSPATTAEPEMAPTEVSESSDLLALSTPSAVPSFAPPAPGKITGTPVLGSGGSGGGQGGTGGGGGKKRPRIGKSSLFGFEDAQEDDLIGTMIDLKLESSGKKPTSMGGTDTDFYGAVRNLLSGSRVNEGALRKYFQVPKKLGATQLFIPSRDAAEAPRVFQVADKVKPNYWVIRYRGKFAAPVSGQYRFVGKADDLLWVAVDGRTVLEAHWDVNNFLTSWRPRDHVNEHSIYDFMGGNTEGDKERAWLTYGDWMTLEAGKPKELEILLGEYGGGRFFALLLIQAKGQEDKKGKSKDRPLIPLFVTAEPTGEQRQTMRSSKIEFPKELPVFAASQPGGGGGSAGPATPAEVPANRRGDTAADPAYESAWQDGATAGSGLGGWILRSNGDASRKSYAGFYVARQEEKAGSEPVATEGRSWAVYADGEGFQEATAFRAFSPALSPGQTFAVDWVAPLPKSNSGSSGSMGLTLRSGNKSESAGDYNSGARLEVAALEGKSNYQIFDGSSPADSGLPVSPGGLRLEFSLKTADTYDLKLSPLDGGRPVELSGRKLGGGNGSPIESLGIFNRDSEQNLFFNRLQVQP